MKNVDDIRIKEAANGPQALNDDEIQWLFMDLDWDDPIYEAIEIECVRRGFLE